MSKIYEPKGKSQSPQAGQFNSYWETFIARPRRRHVSIPSSGSIQFLLIQEKLKVLSISRLNPLKRVNSILTEASSKSASSDVYGLNPLKRVNSILTLEDDWIEFVSDVESQSPQAGQFNSYPVHPDDLPAISRVSIPSSGSIQFLQEIISHK